MRFMVLVYPGNAKAYEAGQMPEAELLAKMGLFNEELVKAGVLLSGEGLQPSSKGVQVHFPGHGETRVSDGPFTEPRKPIGGFWIWKVKSKAEALEWAKRAPMEDGATLELRQVFEPSDFGPDIEQQETSLLDTLDSQQKLEDIVAIMTDITLRFGSSKQPQLEGEAREIRDRVKGLLQQFTKPTDPPA